MSNVGEVKFAKPELDSRGYVKKSKPYGVWDDNRVLWNGDSVGKLVSKLDNLDTLHAIVQNSISKFGPKNAVGKRELIKRDMIEDPDNPGRKLEKLTLGEFKWLSYNQWGERMRNLGSGLVNFAGLQPQDRILIYAETQLDWTTAAFAAWNHNLTVVTAYSTLGPEAAAHAINITKSKLVVADAKLLKTLTGLAKQCPGLKSIVTLSEVDEESKKSIPSTIQVQDIDQLIASGKEKPVPLTVPKADDVAVIMFTSGTTGNPKGVIMAHKCIVAAIAGMEHLIGDMVSEKDVYAAYLPLAHIMELAAEVTQVKFGIPMGFGSPHTLTNTGVKLASGQLGDLVVLKPTIVVFAPLVLERIYNSIRLKVSQGSGFAQWMFGNAMASGLSGFDDGKIGASSFWNSIVFKKIQAITGGNLRLVLTGSAPLDGNVHKFVQTCLNCPVRQGYGSTETCAASVVQEILDNSVSTVGPPRVTACIKFIDWEEGGYRWTDKDDPNIGMPRGEIVIGGEGVTLGYLVNPDYPDAEIESKNETDFKTDEKGVRWFYTGDIGQVTKDGSIQIIDRKKDLVKLQHGEYVALSKVEGVLKLSPFVENVMLHVDSKQTYCTALVCPQFGAIKKFCRENGLDENNLEAACTNEKVVAEVLKSLKETAKGKLLAVEIPKKITLIGPSRTWSPENDLLTAALKLKRKPIINAHITEIEKMYSS
eukprot:c14681_g1_i1.p1 GENE.c14681_g1_i1~~c14681_g1_i1.p1  ORF type:complete len:704 (-),score=325.39 c14681_g1_i1:119-2230(-)